MRKKRPWRSRYVRVYKWMGIVHEREFKVVSKQESHDHHLDVQETVKRMSKRELSSLSKQITKTNEALSRDTLIHEKTVEFLTDQKTKLEDLQKEWEVQYPPLMPEITESEHKSRCFSYFLFMMVIRLAFGLTGQVQR